MAVLVFGLNLIESTLLPSVGSLGKSQGKSWRIGSSKGDDDSADDDSTTPVDSPKATPYPTLPPTALPTGLPTRAPSPVLRQTPVPGNGVPTFGASDPTVVLPTAGGRPSPSQPSASSATNFSYPIIPAPDMSDAAQTFVDRWCELGATDWYPSGDNAWKMRAPAFLIPGTKYGGIYALTNLLSGHPQIIPPTNGDETRFFLEPTFSEKYVKPNEKTIVMQARERLYAQSYAGSDFRNAPGSISYDATAGYLFRSNVLPRRLLCTLPWVKMVVILRDPVKRLYQHYIASKRDKHLTLTLEEWIEKDFDLMRKSGLITNATNPVSLAKKANKTGENVAWYQYQHFSLDGPVGRSLYDIQLRQWFQALQAIGRDPKKSVLIVLAEDFIKDPTMEFARILKWLKLSAFTPPSLDVIRVLANENLDGMAGKTKKRLETFFEPYGKRLEDLLKGYEIPFGSGDGKGWME